MTDFSKLAQATAWLRKFENAPMPHMYEYRELVYGWRYAACQRRLFTTVKPIVSYDNFLELSHFLYVHYDNLHDIYKVGMPKQCLDNLGEGMNWMRDGNLMIGKNCRDYATIVKGTHALMVKRLEKAVGASGQEAVSCPCPVDKDLSERDARLQV